MDRFRKIPCVYKPKIELSTASEEDEIIRKIIIIQSNTYREKTDWEKMTEALQMEELVKELREKTDLEGKTREIVSDLIGVSSTRLEGITASAITCLNGSRTHSDRTS